ncbi:DNA-directed RNA polymerase subunit beta [Streptococcus caprae]|uniref:DNA-directed RNA polymerase subunit beta n=1 Tax=Streptococcus caprae TaxID=1640501 RepID=A0ABV8CSK9_9STRE
MDAFSGWKYVVKQLGFIILIALLCLIFLGIGLVVGYGIIGDGENVWAILSPNKWSSILAQFTGK